jgi:hypothetical protein
MSKQWFIFDKLEGAHIGERAIIDAEGFTICNPSFMGEHNARLIAAAPQLAEAVAAALELLTNPDAEAEDADRITHQLREVLQRLEVKECQPY